MHTIANRNDTAMRILCATDFSPSAAAAATRAARLAHACGGDLELLHVIPLRDAPAYRFFGWEASRRSVAVEAMDKLQTLAAQTRAAFDIPVVVHLALGIAHAQIAARAHATAARLVVVGPHGKHAMRDLSIGSTPHELRRISSVPVLIARNRSTRRYERALVAVDFSAASAQAAHAAASLFPDAALHFLHVCTPLFDTRVALADGSPDAMRAYRNRALLHAGRELDNFIRRNGLQRRRAYSLVKYGYPPACIKDTASELAASVVAFGTKGRSHLEASLLGSVGAQFMGGGGQDVLLAKATQGRSRPFARLRQDDAHAETAIM
jgi:nucleotide-binding universal stress UspA family protein